MLGTAHWYCAKCARFVDPRHSMCETCGRTRGSSRLQEPALDHTRRYWLRVAACRSAASPDNAPSFDT